MNKLKQDCLSIVLKNKNPSALLKARGSKIRARLKSLASQNNLTLFDSYCGGDFLECHFKCQRFQNIYLFMKFVKLDDIDKCLYNIAIHLKNNFSFIKDMKEVVSFDDLDNVMKVFYKDGSLFHSQILKGEN